MQGVVIMNKRCEVCDSLINVDTSEMLEQLCEDCYAEQLHEWELEQRQFEREHGREL